MSNQVVMEDDAKSSRETLDKRIETAMKLSHFALQFAVAVGVISTYCYCAFDAHFFPTGLTLGDGLLFLFVAFGFGSGYVVWLWTGWAVMAGALSHKLGCNKDDRRVMIWMAGAVGGFWILMVVCTWQCTWDFLWLVIEATLPPLVSGFCVCGALMLEVKASKNSIEDEGLPAGVQKRRRQVQAVMIAVALLTPAIVGATPVLRLMSHAMSLLSIRVSSASLLVDEDNFRIIESVASQMGLPIQGCGVSDSNAYFVHGVRVWWHGLGERSFIELVDLGRQKDGKIVEIPGARLELARAGTKVISWSKAHQQIQTCRNIKTDLLFDRNKAEISTSGRSEVDRQRRDIEQQIEKFGWRIESAEVVGYADRQLVRTEGGNRKLSHARAQAVRDALAPLFQGVSGDKIAVEGMGALESRTHCGMTLAGEALNECLAPDRRVEIRLNVTRP
ncbi:MULTISPECIES: OmpA family protein [Hydrocarboniphaga]|nr:MULTISPECIES: OmpA family protein [Hydrocarboniphaga]MDZ4079351.1 OmpA family protein [Hydrocarboniphaga sp.]